MTTFSSPSISIDENGIDLLRNSFANKHINFSEVQHLSIEDGYLLKNRLVILIVGIALIALAIKLFIPVLEVYSKVPENLSTHNMGRGLAFIQMIPLALIGFGGYFTIQSLRKSKILHLEIRTEQFNIRISEIDKSGNLRDLESFLEQKFKV